MNADVHLRFPSASKPHTLSVSPRSTSLVKLRGTLPVQRRPVGLLLQNQVLREKTVKLKLVASNLIKPSMRTFSFCLNVAAELPAALPNCFIWITESDSLHLPAHRTVHTCRTFTDCRRRNEAPQHVRTNIYTWKAVFHRRGFIITFNPQLPIS